ncbi:hypothetical protein BGZ94_001423, partial [Podila epigama]
GWFGTTELRPLDPASAEKTKAALKKGNGLRTALAEALDPSLIAQRAPSQAEDYEDEDGYDEEPVAPKKKAASKAKAKKTEKTRGRARDDSDSELASPVEKKRRPSASDDFPAKKKPVKRAVPADEEEDENKSTKPKKRLSVSSRSRQESDMKSVDEDISLNESSNGRTKRSDEDAGDSGDHARAKKKIRSGQPNERLLKLRHKLQKLLLVEGLSDEVLVQNLDRADPILAEVEAFEIDLQMLKDTKIGRLMKKISYLQFSHDQHNIVNRSLKLIKYYKSMMEAHANGENAPYPSAALAIQNEAHTGTTSESAAATTTTTTTTTTTVSSSISMAEEVKHVGGDVGSAVVHKLDAASPSSLAVTAPAPIEATTEAAVVAKEEPVVAAPAPEAVVAAVAAIVDAEVLPSVEAPSTEADLAPATDATPLV